MELILWRHAEAEDGGFDKSDTERRLTAHGEKQARDMAKWLKPRLPKKLKVLVSPAARTQQTAHALALPFEIEPRIATGADVDDLIAAARLSITHAAEYSGAVILVGHQPTLGQLAAKLLTGVEADWSIKKGAIWWFSRQSRTGSEQAMLRAVMNPEMLR
ncbi:MAG: histidine phosphatase family protein [Rhodocyclaceae bacterium]|nr:histidine phosphatase family protein [Rhodocyclaceae bacterium]